MGHTARILEALKEGPGTQRELADELDICRKVCCALLLKLYKSGRVTRKMAGGVYVYDLPC